MVDTPEPEPVGGRGGVASSGGRGGDDASGGRGGGVNAGTGGRAGSASEAGSSGNSGSSGDDEPDAGTVVTPQPPRQYCNAVENVFRETCGNGSCHTNDNATIGDFGAGEEQAASYVGRGSVRNAACGLIIDPVEPQDSLILTKVTGTFPQDRGCGGRMPVGSYEITDEQIECISDWVEQFRE